VESIYWVVSWYCHRTCPHCYDERFRPYVGAQLESLVKEAASAYPEIVRNLPARMTYLDAADPFADGRPSEKVGSIILAGGEVLTDPVRERILYPLLSLLHDRYEANGGVKLVVQTTGDLLTDGILEELLDHHVWMISVSGLDGFHKGLETEEAREALRTKLVGLLEARGLVLHAPLAKDARDAPDSGRYYQLWGATPDTWIGKLWPRGRGFSNELTTATLADNFCNRWSGGLNFLAHRYAGSEVSIDPSGDVYPCCPKTRSPVGNLRNRKLEEILDGLAGNPVYEAISMGHPERMGLAHGWSVERFLENSTIVTPSGRTVRNLCVGCDRFHQDVLGAPVTGEGVDRK